MKKHIGLGIAGNFAGHLEQAGEARDFESVEVKEQIQPKALFPVYVPDTRSGFLSTYPLSHDRIHCPDESQCQGEPFNLQIEPEVAVLFKLSYQDDKITGLTPLRFGAYNDCSIRRPNARKISEKKNWGEHSKGISEQLIEIDHFGADGIMNRYRIASFLRRNDECFPYGIDSPISGYSYFNEKLLDWMIDKMNHQLDQGPMESIAMHLQHANYPQHALVSIGATRYTKFGETHFLEPGDQSIVIVYDGDVFSPQQIAQQVAAKDIPDDHVSVLIQDVV